MDPLSHSLRSLCSLQHLFILQFGADRPANVLYFSSTQVGRHPRKVLQNFRSIISGVLYQFLFNQKLSTPQWWSLVLLTVGAMSKEVSLESGLHFNISSTGSKKYHNPNYTCNFQNKALMWWSKSEISKFCATLTVQKSWARIPVRYPSSRSKLLHRVQLRCTTSTWSKVKMLIFGCKTCSSTQTRFWSILFSSFARTIQLLII